MERRFTIADTGFLNFSTFSSDSTVGTISWTNPSNAASSNDVWASAAISTTTDFAVDDNSVRLFYNGAYAGTDKASATNWNPGVDSTRTYGGSTDVWGLTPGFHLINDATFGVGISAQRDASTPETHYLKCTGATSTTTLPSGARVDGIEVTVECYYQTSTTSFAVGTLVLTPTGLVRNDVLKVGDLVASFDSNNQLRSQRIKALKRSLKPVFRLVAAGEEALVTATEKMLVGVNEFKKLSELKAGDVLYREKNGLLVPVPIEAIERAGEEDVISIEVENDHTYIAGGFAVHNVLIGGFTTAYIDHVQIKIYYTKTFHPW